jgi:transglutaminase-like putative cysteine protease
MKAFRYLLLLVAQSILLSFLVASCSRPGEESINNLIAKGEFSKAQTEIREFLKQDTTLTSSQRLHWQFEIERLDRIRLDFRTTEQKVKDYIGKYMPSLKAEDYARLEASHALEAMTIDGEKRYFNSAARNLFRLDPQSRSVWKEAHKDDPPDSALASEQGLDEHIAQVMEAAVKSGKHYVKPVRMHIMQSITVNGNEVPEGEIICCWLPFPREIPGRQEQIRIIATEPQAYMVASNDSFLQRTVYLEKPSAGTAKTKFSVEYEYTSNGVYWPVDPSRVTAPVITPELAPFVREEPPHMVFTSELKTLSREIVRGETNPLLIARKLYAWVDTNVTWASAREYSTVSNISMYAFENHHGDCGMQTLLFMTLCRLNGIPVRWQSGWEFRPPGDSMHDWGMIYFAPYGWVPMDVTYGLRSTGDETMKYFYVNGMDSYRLIFNDAISQPFYPAKMFPRSETIDSQRGEVEWRGGNLYFDKWEWELQWDKIN